MAAAPSPSTEPIVKEMLSQSEIYVYEEKNEIILTDNNILLRIDRMEKNRIERIYIRLPEPLEETGSEQKSEE